MIMLLLSVGMDEECWSKSKGNIIDFMSFFVAFRNSFSILILVVVGHVGNANLDLL